MLSDLRYALRTLRRSPGFAAAALLTLALGIGATSTVFSVVDGVLLRPLAFPESDRLVLVLENNANQGWDQFSVSPANFLDFRERARSFEGMAAYTEPPVNLTGGGEPERVIGAVVTEGFFELLRVKPLLGRTFTADEMRPGGPKVVLLSYGLWQRRFGGALDIVGRAITINGEPVTVVGVMPREGAEFPSHETELWAPLTFGARALAARGAHWVVALARLKPGVTLDQASAEIGQIASSLARQYPASNSGWGARAWSLHELTVGDVRPALEVLFGVVALVLAIACANVASLLLARGAARRREVAIRSAVGASVSQIVRQLLAESLLLGAMGGALGLLLAMWGVDLLHAVRPDGLPRLDAIAVDDRVLAFTTVVSLLTGLAFGLVPALQTARPNLAGALRDAGGRGATLGRAGQRLRSGLVVAEVALSLVLLVGAGLMAKSFLRLRQVSPGFTSRQLLTASVELPGAKYPSDTQRVAFARRAMERLGGLPGVRAVALASPLPMGRNDRVAAFVIDGRPAPP
ncbi:MAG TPA: ABC transporter permease, partial [Gemmatimonadaceae bacterium]|nr:ABC transporter permease [Gemmatimonadaceae bacterium]